MKVYDTTQIRNLAVVGHGHAGKTSLVSALLYAAGAVNRLGRVDDGTAVTDSDPEEQERKISIACGLAQFEHGGVKMNLIDTPGYGDFIGEARAGIRAADTILSVVHGVAGAQVQTVRTWNWAESEGLAGAFVVNMLDRERADFGKVVASLQETFTRAAIPLAIPIGSEHELAGVVSLIDMKAYMRPAEGSATGKVEAIPAAVADAAKAARAALVEMVAEADEALMEAFFAKGDLDDAVLRDGLRTAIASRQIFPVFPASATHVVGIHALLESIAAVFPSPAARPAQIGKHAETGAEIACAADSATPLALQVFKTISDQFGTLTLARVFSGTLKHDSNVNNASRNTSTRFGHLLTLRGREQTAVDEIKAGDIVAAAKLKDVHTGDSLGDKSRPVVFPPIPFPEAIISFAISAKNKGEDEKIAAAIHRLSEEDLTIHFYHHPETGDQLLSGMGTEHVRVTVSKMQKRFGVEATLRPPRIPYRETIKKKAETTARHKKQTGGHGQFAECKISLEPLPHGGGYEFVDDIFGGSISQNYRPSVDKGIQESARRGFLAGYPVVDIRVTLLDGKEHAVDSSDMAFKIAGSMAFKEAMALCAPTLLEPVMHVSVAAPEEYMGDLMGDLSSRRGRVQGMDTQPGMQVIKAQVPMAEMLEYASTLKSITSDRGVYTMSFSHYEEIPVQFQDKVIAESKAAREAENKA
jgi:elongation factor G